MLLLATHTLTKPWVSLMKTSRVVLHLHETMLTIDIDPLKEINDHTSSFKGIY